MLNQKYHPRAFMPDAMNLVIKRKKNLLTTKSLSGMPLEKRLKQEAGFTDHPAFLNDEVFPKCYRLKEGFSARVALVELLSKYHMVVDGGVAHMIATYISILLAMRKVHGLKNGNQRFDNFFGSTQDAVPHNRRMLLCSEGPIMGSRDMPIDILHQRLPLQPLSFVVELVTTGTKEKLLSQIKKGATLIFDGDPDYDLAHPRGSKGYFVCVVTNTNPLTVSTFDYDKNNLTEKDLIKEHMIGYQKLPSLLSLISTNAQNLSFYSKKYQADPKRIAGFLPNFLDFKEDELYTLIAAIDFPKVTDAYSVYAEIEDQASASCLNTPVPYIPKKPPMAQVTSPFFYEPYKIPPTFTTLASMQKEDKSNAFKPTILQYNVYTKLRK